MTFRESLPRDLQPLLAQAGGRSRSGWRVCRAPCRGSWRGSVQCGGAGAGRCAARQPGGAEVKVRAQTKSAKGLGLAIFNSTSFSPPGNQPGTWGSAVPGMLPPLRPGLAQVPLAWPLHLPGALSAQLHQRAGKEGTGVGTAAHADPARPGSPACPAVTLLSHQRGILSPGPFNSSIRFPRVGASGSLLSSAGTSHLCKD